MTIKAEQAQQANAQQSAGDDDEGEMIEVPVSDFFPCMDAAIFYARGAGAAAVRMHNGDKAKAVAFLQEMAKVDVRLAVASAVAGAMLMQAMAEMKTEGGVQ